MCLYMIFDFCFVGESLSRPENVLFFHNDHWIEVAIMTAMVR